ncbi:peptidylprolyl isomerase [soil metagenome]
MRRILIAVSILAACALPAAAQAPAAQPDWRAPDPENTLVIDTSKGRVIVELQPLAANAHIERIKILTRRKFYDGLTFFRVIDEFMAQTGDPLNTGEGGSDLPDLAAQFTFKRNSATPFTMVSRNGSAVYGFVGSLPVITQPDEMMYLLARPEVNAYGAFCPGVAGMARSDDPHSANSQFFLMRQMTDDLNAKYTAFGRVISGLDVVRAIKAGEPPQAPVDKMTQVRVLADILQAERPYIQTQNTAGPAFKAYVEKEKASKGASFSICDLEIRTDVR